jgi:hypothetical protein
MEESHIEDLVSLTPRKDPMRAVVVYPIPSRRMRKPTRTMVSAAVTIQRFYTYYLASNVAKFGVTCENIVNMTNFNAFEKIKDKLVVATMKTFLLRVLVLTEHGIVRDDSAKKTRTSVNARSFTWAYISAYSVGFMEYQERIGNTFSKILYTTATEMLETFEKLRIKITSSPRGADHERAVNEALQFPHLIRKYGVVFNEWELIDRQITIGVCKIRMTKLYELEDGFATADSVSKKAQKSLRKSKEDVRRRIHNTGVIGKSTLKKMDQDRLHELLAQVGHELLIDPDIDINQYKYKFASTDQFRLPNLVLLVEKKRARYEREYMYNMFVDGSRRTDKTYEWFLSTFRSIYGYGNGQITDMQYREACLSSIVKKISPEDVTGFLGMSFVAMLCDKINPVLAKCPETLHFDLYRIAVINKGFHLQHLVITLVQFLKKTILETDRKALYQFDVLQRIANKVIFYGVCIDDMDEILNIVCDTIKMRYPTVAENRDNVERMIFTELHSKDNNTDNLTQILRNIMYLGIDYKDQFNDVTQTRRIFKQFKLPIEAIGLSGILHMQCTALHKMVKINSEVHSKRYGGIMQNVAIALLYEYP